MTNYQFLALLGIICMIISILIDLLWDKDIIQPKSMRKAYIYLPTVIYYICMFFGCSITDIVLFFYKYPIIYSLVIILLAVFEVICYYFDSLIVLVQYRKRGGFTKLTANQKYYISKFGDDKQVIDNMGRCDISKDNILYSFFSNLTGGLCPLTLLLFIKTLPNSYQFINDTNWIDFFGICGPAMVIPGIEQTSAQLRKSRPKSVNSAINSDNYRFDRLHILSSVIALWFTNVMVVVYGLIILIYSFCNIGGYELNTIIALPIISLTIFLLHQAISPVSYVLRAVNVDAYMQGKYIVIAVLLLELIVCKKTVRSIISVVICLIILLFWNWMIKYINIQTKSFKPWMKSSRWVQSLIVIALFIVLVMVCFQLIQLHIIQIP